MSSYDWHRFGKSGTNLKETVEGICGVNLQRTMLGDSVQFSSVQFSWSVVYDSLRPHELQHARPPCPSPTPRVHPNSWPSNWWCHLAISSSVIPFSSGPQSFPASGSFPTSQSASCGQSIGASASALVLSMNIQDWFILGWTGLISLQSKGLSRVFPKTTVQKHQSFGTQPSLWSNCTPIHEYWKNHSSDYTHFVGKVTSLLLLCCLGWS